jgi:replicative DNA helicase
MSARDHDDEVTALRVPPHSVEAEQSVLGGLLLDNLAWDRAADLLIESDFYRHEHRLIFTAIAGLVNASKPADVITVFEQLQRLGKDDDCGGLAYLNALAQSVPSAANMRRYAEIVAERAKERRLIHALDEALALAWHPSGSAAEKTDQAAALIDRLARAGQPFAPKSMQQLVGPAIERYNELFDDKREPGIPTHFAQLDRLLGGGLKPGKLYGVAARPAVGKSSFARSIAIRVARQGHTVLVLSQEMPQDEQTDCVIAEMGAINSERLQQTSKLEPEEWERLPAVADDASQLPLHFDEQGSLTIASIRAKARSVKGVAVLIVDYLQLCATTLKGKSTNDEIAEISKGLKALAMAMKIPVIVLSQLNREAEKRDVDKGPLLIDLRDSGAIEQDLDACVFLWNVEGADEDSRIVGFKVAKNRSGRLGSFAMRFDAPFYRWTDCGFLPPKASKPKGKVFE